MRTLAQKRAEYALEKVLLVKNKKDFRPFVAGAPAGILQNGLGQTLAFWLAKGTNKDGKIKEDDKHIELFDIVKDWMSWQRNDVHNNFAQERDRMVFVKELSKMKLHKYLAVQNETLALLEWVKRFAAADLQ